MNIKTKKSLQHELPLDDSPDKYRLLVENVNDAIVISQDNKFIFFNNQFADLLGYKPAELYMIDYRRVYTKKSVEILNKRNQMRKKGENVSSRYETIFLKKDGSEVVLEANVTIIDYQNKNATFAVLRDITERKKVEKELVEKEERYRTIFDLSPGGFILEDMQGMILDVNPAFCDSMGYQRDELVGNNIRMLAHPEHSPDVEKNLHKLKKGNILKHRVKSLRKDGSVCYMDLTESKISLPGNQEGILSVAKDITEHILAEEERLQQEKMKSIIEIAGAVCHELNQPMTVVSVTCDLLLMNRFSREEADEKIRIIKNQLKRMTNMTHKLMNLTRYETREYMHGTNIVDLDRAAD